MRKLVLLALALLPGAVYAQDATVSLLEKLANAPGPPGAEGPVRAVMVPIMKPLASKLSYDGMGSVMAQVGRAGRALWWTPTWTSWAGWCGALRRMVS